MKKAVLSLAIAFLWLSCPAQQNEPVAKPSLEEAEKAIMQLDHQTASKLLKELFNDQGLDLKERAEAGQKLARMTWHVYGHLDEARRTLRKAAALKTKEFQTFKVLSGIELEGENYGLAREAAKLALAFAESRFETHDAYLAFAKATLDEAVNGILSSSSSSKSDHSVANDKALLQKSFFMVDSVMTEEPGQITPSEVSLGMSLLLRNGPKAYGSWCQYYRIPENMSATGLMEKPQQSLKQILPSWTGQDLSMNDCRSLVLALADSRFFTYAAMVANLLLDQRSRNTPEIQNILVYERFLRKIRQTTIDFYELSVLGKESESEFKKALREEAKEIWHELNWPADRPAFSMNRFYAEIQQRYGADVRMDKIAGYFGLNMGHRVFDEEREIEQYGKKAKLRYISLDFMVSNGYTGWFWDGRAQPGGWAQNPIIAQVRRAYADGGIRAWKFITDSLKGRETEKEIARFSSIDDSLASVQPHAYLPGLALRIKNKSYTRLLKSLKAQGMANTRLRTSFISEVDRLKVESSIFAHEGRHALDRRSFLHWSRSSTQKEFNAKLSEVASSDAPFLAMLGGILLSNIGDGTSHGQANQRIMEGLVNWMQQHRSEIAELDSDRPLLPQLDLLTDEQLRRVFRGMDSEAN
jgi:hypothetical protein